MRASLWLFFTFYLVLPKYFALEFSESLPLLTASRVIILILAVACLHKKKISIRLDKSFLIYFAIMACVYLYHIVASSAVRNASIKGLFSLIIEQMILYIMLLNLIITKKDLIAGLDLIVKVCGVLCVLAIFETISGINLFLSLTTTQRKMTQAFEDRLGLLRAETSFGHPVTFAAYLVCVFPFAVFFYESTKKMLYANISVLIIIAVFCTGSRGGLGVLVALVACMLVFKGSIGRRMLLRQLLLMAGSVVVIAVIFPSLLSYGQGIFESLLAALGIISANQTAFGSNQAGLPSRIAQFTGLIWAYFNNALVLGFGPQAHMSDLIRYDYGAGFTIMQTIDVGYVGIVLQYGFVGLAGYVALFCNTIRNVLKRSNKRQTANVYNAYLYMYIGFLFLLLTVSEQIQVAYVLTLLLFVYENLDRKEKRERLLAAKLSN